MTIPNDLTQPNGERYDLKLTRYAVNALSGQLVGVLTSVAALAVTLPAPGNAGTCIAVGDNDGNAATNPITVSVAGGGTIDGAATYAIATAGLVVQFIDDGTQWRRIIPIHLVYDARRKTTDGVLYATDLPAGATGIPLRPATTQSLAANQLLYDGVADGALQPNSVTRIYETIAVKKDGAAEGGTIEMSAVFLRAGNAAPVRVTKPCPCASGGQPTVTKLLDNAASGGGTSPAAWSTNYNAGGGLCVVAYGASAVTTTFENVTLQLVIDGVVVDTRTVRFNDGRHMTLPAGVWNVTLSAGAHSIALKIATGGTATTDNNDFASLTVVEFPAASAGSDPVEYALTPASTISGTTVQYALNFDGTNYYVQTQVSPSTAGLVRYTVERDQRPSVFAG